MQVTDEVQTRIYRELAELQKKESNECDHEKRESFKNRIFQLNNDLIKHRQGTDKRMSEEIARQEIAQKTMEDY